MTTLDEAYAAEGIAKPKARHAHPEWDLQTKLVGFAREYIITPHEFAAHDRSRNVSGMQHFWEKQRGLRADWPDTEIPLLGGLTWRCELKAAGIAMKEGSDQWKMIARLNALGHPTDWANSARMWLVKARVQGIEFRAGADVRAAVIDAMLASSAAHRALAKPKKRTASRPRREPTSGAGLRVMARARAKGVLA